MDTLPFVYVWVLILSSLKETFASRHTSGSTEPSETFLIILVGTHSLGAAKEQAQKDRNQKAALVAFGGSRTSCAE